LKISPFETQLLPEELWDTAEKFFSRAERNFVLQAEFLGLDRNSDFRHANLAQVDFSYCDLRGFDFTGADLRGAFGVHVKWDATTELAGADARGSLFSYSLAKASYFDTHPEELETVQRLARENWTHAILGVEKLLRQDGGHGSALKIAQALFDQTRSTVVRSNILAFMRLASPSATEHKAFIFNVFARFSDEPSVIVAAIRTVSTFYRDDMQVFRWLKLFLESGDANQRREAFKGLLASKHFMRSIASLREYAINSTDSLTRRVFLGRLAEFAGPRYVLATTDTEVTNFIDFALPITRRKLDDMASRALQMRRLKSVEFATSHSGTEALAMARVKDSEVREMARDIRRYLSALGTQYKIPFVFDL
jgi:hypothetical protein